MRPTSQYISFVRYDSEVTYETVIDEMLLHFPALRQQLYDYIYVEDGETKSLPFAAFGSVLLPHLERALSESDLATILKTCAFLEDASLSSRMDPDLNNLIGIEIGEWLAWTSYESLIGPFLGPETKRICRYIPGLAMQRNELRHQKKQSLFKRVRHFLQDGR